MKKVNVAIIGYKFMGKAHSSAWLRAPRFFRTGLQPVLKIACGRDAAAAKTFAENWGWEAVETDWRRVVARDDIDIVDISLPQNLHAEVAIEAARHGKHIFCEKPLALNVAEAEAMVAAVETAGVKHYLNHNYRRCPAVALAKRFVDEGRLGRLFHWRSAYQQDWIVDPRFPLTWHLRKETAGSGPHGDLGSHSVDLALWLMGKVRSVSCLTTNFIKERPLPGEGAATFSAGTAEADAETGEVTVEDASLMQVSFDSGALGSFELTRFATGRKNRNAFEIYGSKGALGFDMERMNELEYYSIEDAEEARGFRTILVTEGCHPYVEHWWPPGHIIGYEHAFVHGVADFLRAIETDGEVRPNFHDGLETMRVLEAALQSSAEGRTVVL